MKKILVVDDDPDIRYAIKESFFTEYDIISADSGKKCLQILETKNPWCNPTWYYDAWYEWLGNLKAGCFLGDDYIEKPFEINDLKSRIEKIFKNRKWSMALLFPDYDKDR